jgi:hypothetical protein
VELALQLCLLPRVQTIFGRTQNRSGKAFSRVLPFVHDGGFCRAQNGAIHMVTEKLSAGAATLESTPFSQIAVRGLLRMASD